MITAVAIGFAAFTWWPNGDYAPIQPAERGTIASGVRAIADIPTGRPALTRASKQELGGAPTLREQIRPGADPEDVLPGGKDEGEPEPDAAARERRGSGAD